MIINSRLRSLSFKEYYQLNNLFFYEYFHLLYISISSISEYHGFSLSFILIDVNGNPPQNFLNVLL